MVRNALIAQCVMCTFKVIQDDLLTC